MRETAGKLIREIREDGVFDLAASVAFWLLLSFPAALLAMLSSVSLLGDDLTDELRVASLEFIDRVFADQAESLSESIDGLFDQRRPGIFSASLAVAVFTLSRGFAGLIRGLDAVYDVDDTRNFAHTRALAIGLAVGTLGTVALSTALWAVSGNYDVALVVRVVGALIVLVLWSATMFHIGPNLRTPWIYDVPGAVLAAAGWLGLSLGFGWYVRLLGGEGSNDVIGVAGALLLGLTWLWAACVVFLIGGELNQVLAENAGVIDRNRTVLQRLRTRRRVRPDEPTNPPE